jgi:hypothetical protein
MVQIVQFKRQAFLSQPTANGLPIALIEHGKGSRYELLGDVTTADAPNGFVKITIRPTPDNKQTWFAEAGSVEKLSVDKISPTLPADSTPSIIEFTNPNGSFLKQNPAITGDLNDTSGNVIFQGKGAKCEVYFTGAENLQHREIRIPIKPGDKETWWVFKDHIS